MKPVVHVIIPAYNEAPSIGQVIGAIPRDVVDEIIVVDNASTDDTAAIARGAGATILHEPVRGYGKACLKGIAWCKEAQPAPGIVVFMDGDFSDYPEEMPSLVEPIIKGEADLVIGSRSLGQRERGALTVQQIFGNWLATRLLKLLFKTRFTDLGPFRAIRFSTLLALDMRDPTYGWTVEMQVKAAKRGVPFREVPVRYRKRIGTSKISGTLKGTVMAGYKILYTLVRYI